MAAILPRQLDRLEEHEFPKGFNPKAVRAFLDETSASGGAELANSQSIIRDLCKVLGVAAPKLKHAGADNPYCFEEDVKEGKAHRRIDVYKRGCFVLEAKQGADPKTEPADALARSAAKAKVGHSKSAKGAGTRGTAAWVEAMKAGFFQAAAYAVNVTQRKDPKPPFVVVMDLGHRFWIWSSFQPDAKDDYGDFELEAGFAWEDLLRPEVFKFLRQVWETPEELNEEVQGQRVTAEIAAKVSDLALRLEKRLGKKSAERVGDFLMKCVFTMFAEDVGMIPRGLLTRRLDEWLLAAKAGKPDRFVKGLRSLWSHMNDGGDLDSGETIRRFNGYLFKNPEPIELALDELEALRATAAADWRRVSPAIFGTLLERALTPEERHKLGAHYTPEAYIRRLVDRTMMAPLRVEWRNARAEMEKIQLTGKVKQKAEADAMKVGLAFRTRLATVRVLDPACGSGNFLYVALKELKRLEGEVDRALRPQKGYKRAMDFQGESVHPVQFHGIELKPWAAKVAELVLWIGYLQWQVTAGRFQAMQEPLIQDLHHIECRDALITWKKAEAVVDEDGAPVLRAIGVSDKKAERRMVPVERLVGVKVAPWPEADFVVGNPPFLGNKRLNDVLPPGYVEAIKAAYPEVPGTADLVMWWWWRCAALVGAGKLQRFGLVTTNSITQTSNRAVATAAIEKGGLRLAWAIPDHPWYDEGLRVRIAMTVAEKGGTAPLFGRVVDETATAAAGWSR
ncbi:MAG: class I SAM-dependent DNA methyltransferase [Deltaproteobacteria bacterium]|nr:class I SAM-dependent DNA methyltransferase [Deltaproteobacteria bacterium]